MAVIPGLTRKPGSRAPGDVPIQTRDAAIRFGDDRRLAAVGFGANPDIQRQRAKKRDLVLLGHPLSAAFAENMFLMATL